MLAASGILAPQRPASSLTGMVEISWSQATCRTSPVSPARTSTAVIRRPSRLRPTTRWRRLHLAAARATTRAATCSHICPGPSFGYRNRSTRLVSVDFWAVSRRRNGSLLNAWAIALLMDRPLMRWAPHSAEICAQGTPQTFSV